MKVTLPDRVSGSRDALLVLEVEFPVATEERKVALAITGPLQALDLQGGQAGGVYPVPVGLERLHIPLRVTADGAAEAKVIVTCEEGPESGQTAQRTLTLEAPQAVAAGGGGTRMALIGLLLAGLAAGGVILAPKFFGGPRVPGVEGQTEAEALASLKKSGYVVARPTLEDVQDRDQHGKVLRTIPPGGERLDKGARVEVVLGNFGATQLLVPNVRGSPREAALASLKAAGFEAEVKLVAAERPEEAGRVVRQVPAAGMRVDRGVAVQLRVADLSITPTPTPVDPPPGPDPVPPTPGPDPVPPTPGPDPVPPTPGPDPVPPTPGPDPVPPTPGPDPVPPTPGPDPVPPTPGPTPPGPDDGRIAVPKLVGLAEAEAHRQLEELGTFAVVRMKPTPVVDEVGKVLEQDPAPATRIFPTDAITISVGIRGASLPPDPVPTPGPDPVPTPGPDPVPTPAPDLVAVPDLIGLSETDALQLISEVGLRSTTQTETTEDVPAGQILSQEPAAGSQVEKDSVVTMIVAEPPASPTPVPTPDPDPPTRDTVLVPDVLNLQEADARQKLEAAGLGVIVKREAGPPRMEGYVASQRPDPETRVAKSSLVELTVFGDETGTDPVPPTPGPDPIPPTPGPDPVPPTPGPDPVPPTPGPDPVPPTPGPDPVPPTPGPTPPGPAVDPNDPAVQERDRNADDLPEPDISNVPPPAVGPGVFRAPPPQRMGAEPVPVVKRLGSGRATLGNLVGLSAKDAITNCLRGGLVPIVSPDRTAGGSPQRISEQSPAVGTELRLGDFVRLKAPIGGSPQEQTYDLRFFVGELVNRVVPMYRNAGVQVSVIEVENSDHPYANTGRVVAQYPMYSVPISQARFVTLWVVKKAPQSP